MPAAACLRRDGLYDQRSAPAAVRECRDVPVQDRKGGVLGREGRRGALARPRACGDAAPRTPRGNPFAPSAAWVLHRACVA